MNLQSINITKVSDISLDQSNWPLKWFDLTPHRKNSKKSNYQTQVMLGYNDKGIYIRFFCEDQKISCTDLEDFDDLFEQDVVEIFFQPDISQRIYFEYEISPLGKELPLLVSNSQGRFMGWLPWKYEGIRRVQFHIAIFKGKQAPQENIKSWQASIFLPFALLEGLGNTPPQKGTTWRGNFFRMDYDHSDKPDKWELFSKTNGEFHQYQDFGQILFL